MMRTDAGFHADQARRHVGKAGLDLATRPFLTQHNRATLIVAHDVERVLADIDTNHGNCSVLCLGHGVLLVLTPLASLSLVEREHGRTIPLTEVEQQLPTITAHRLRCRPVRGGSDDVTSKFYGCRRPNVTTPGADAAGKSGRPVRNASCFVRRVASCASS